MKAEIIKVKAKNTNYNVHIGYNNFSDIINLIEENKLSKKIFALIDKSVFNAHKLKIIETFIDVEKFEYVIFEPHESKKNIDSILSIYTKILAKKFSRECTFVAIGGGIVGDLFGFVAATFMRGVNYIQVPTTVLSCVDSSIGGKTGFNFLSYKNIIGSIFQPSFVLIDTQFLTSLKKNQVINGIGEIVKTCFLIGKPQVTEFSEKIDRLIECDNTVMTTFIKECVKFKAGIVTVDEKETLGMRKILNLGHTFAHAIEKETNFKVQHGEAVIIGIVCSLYLSFELKFLDNNMLIESLEVFDKLYPYIRFNSFDVDKVYNAMKQDKKNKDNSIRFVLLKDYGQTLVDIEADKRDVVYAINQGIEFFNRKTNNG
ncbi:MAG: 3-dehydroquinate synthase [bacterium]